ncbi:MAG: lipase family protein [Gammaproteobacteria bacterium]|nr:lipase family protein [Gammaproteobacteria bacterium]MYJ51421.1 lipase family protein [Gammaproteobacteria bacterium]
MDHAFDEFQDLVSKLPEKGDSRDPIIRYVCALVSELCYHHVPKFEIDGRKRAKVIPSDGYADIIETREAIDIEQYLGNLDLNDRFVVVDRGIVAVGIRKKERLFIGFRGTSWLYDWRINIRAAMVDMPFGHWYGPCGCRVHRGFSEEALRVAVRVMDKIRDMTKTNNQKCHLFLTGHSLGGAVAALMQNIIRFESCSTITFGSPRFCNAAAYYDSPLNPPTNIRRVDDIVPSIPPKCWGYADHLYELDTSGEKMLRPIRSSGWKHLAWCMRLLLGKDFPPHRMESYRKELGKNAKVQLWNEQLTPYKKLQKSHAGS